jgi:hypothetical protein
MSESDRGRSKSKDKGKSKPKSSAGGKEKGKGGDMDESTIENFQGMISKWVSIPYGIIVVLVAGSALNLADYFLQLKDDLGFSPLDQQFIKWGVVFGYYGGALAGPFVDLVGTTVAFPIAAFFAGGGFIALGFITEAEGLEVAGTIGVVALVIFVSFACAIASITAISTITINFSKSVGPTVASIMITYYWVAPLFDVTVRAGYFEDVPLKMNMIATGVIMFVVFLLAGLIMNENEQKASLKKASSLTDRFGLFIYAIIAGGFVASIYLTVIIAEQWRFGVFLMALFILINFISLGFTIQMLLGRIKTGDSKNAAEETHPERKNVCEMIFDIRYFCLLFGSFIVIGSGTTYYLEAPGVGNAIGDSELGAQVNKAFWLSAVASTLGGGIIAATFNKLINGWVFAAMAAGASALGFGFVFLADGYGVFWFYLSAFFVGAGTGGWWVIVPQLILDDAGPKNFESLWGIALTVNAFGIFAFEQLFEWISEKAEPATVSDCSGVGCFMVPYIVSGVLCLIAVGLSFIALSNDNGSGSNSEKKPLKSNDANGGGKSSSSAKGKSKSKSKSKTKK